MKNRQADRVAFDRVLTAKEERNLNAVSLEEYYCNLRQYLQGLPYHSSRIKGFNKTVSIVNKVIRSFPVFFEGNIAGIENIENAVFCFNHSNSHDIPIMVELMNLLKRKLTLFAARDGLDFLSEKLFIFSGAELIDRTDSVSCITGETNAVHALLDGSNVVVFPEATWNLHPYKPMLPLHIGACRIAAKSEKPVIPVIMEYVESSRIAKKESEIFEKCIVRIGAPIFGCNSANMFEKTQELENQMSEMRKDIWRREGKLREKISDVDVNVYLNHLKLKTNFGNMHYNFPYELQFVRKSSGGQRENAFCIDEATGQFVPMK